MVSRMNIVGYDCGVEYDPDGYYVRYSDYAALEAQLTARTGGVKPLDEDDYEEIISAAAINMRKATSGIRGQVITVQDSLDWWVMKETERRILSALSPAPEAQQDPETHPDNAPASQVLAYLFACANSWEPEARIIGNARAGDIVRALSDVLPILMQPEAQQEPVAWMDDGTLRAGSDRTAHRVVTDEQKRDMPSAVRSSFNVPLYTRPSEQAVTEAMELARAVLAQSIAAGHNVLGPTPEDIEKAFWALDAALKAAMEAKE